MGRLAKGSVTTKTTKRGGLTFSIRFQAYGRRRSITLGTSAEGWNRHRAEAELANVLADVRRGTWRPHTPTGHDEPPEVPTFHLFASEWLAAREPELRPRTVEDYRWALTHHLLPFFAKYRLNEITVAEVDRYRAEKVAKGQIGPAQINKTLKRLAQILEVAVDYDYLARNPAASKGGRRRVKEPKPGRAWVEPEQLMALLDGAPQGHRPILATMAGAGLRVGEAVALDWGDVNLATGTIIVRKAKTSAGTGRVVDMPGGLLDELKEHRGTGEVTPDEPVFKTRGKDGPPKRQHPHNVQRRLKTAVKRANAELEKVGIEPMSERVSPHSLRRTFASLRAALNDDPVYIAEQGGWEDPTFPLRVYAQAIKRRDRLSGAYLAAFDRALAWATRESALIPEADRSHRAAKARQGEWRAPEPRR